MADDLRVAGLRAALVAHDRRCAAWLFRVTWLFLVSAFVLPAGPDYALIFYVAVIPCSIVALTAGLRPSVTPGFAFAMALAAWSGCTLIWGIDVGHRSAILLGDTICTSFLIVGSAIVLRDPDQRRAVRWGLIAAAGANAAWSLVIGLVFHPDVERLTGWGVTRHPILGAASIAGPFLIALHEVLAGTSAAKYRIGSAAAATLMAAFILFTGSRGPLLAVACATAFLCATGPWRRTALPCFAVAVGLWLAPALLVDRHGVENHAAVERSEPAGPPEAASAPIGGNAPAWVQASNAEATVKRGTSYRLEIWAASIREIEERPLFGHGLADNLDIVVSSGATLTFPHSLYLSLAFYSGIVGLGLFAAMVVAAAVHLVRHGEPAELPWIGALILNALLAGLTDLGQITKGPGPIWFIIWLPLLFAITAPGIRRKGAGRQGKLVDATRSSE